MELYGCRHNKYMYEIIIAQKPAKITAQILWTWRLNLSEINSVELNLPSISFIINKNSEICPYDV